ncbi:Dbl homology domain-containing protein [Syncephalis fuscata]|nr:Dbl homology domain-containing protein [Syncephalis fuscata]
MEQLETDRRKAVFNLIRCEQKHLRGLVLLKGAFADPLRKVLQQQVEQTSTEVFTEEKLDCIFACAIKTIQFHKMFLRDLERAIKEHAQTGTLENAYNAFNNHMPGFRFYLHYMKQYPDMMATFDELYSSNQLFRRTLEECAEQVEHINIRALLSNPLEHITHYHTFLQKILELYSYEDPEYHGFMKCVKQIRQIKSESAKLARTVRQGEEVRQVQASLKGLTMPLATPTRQLIYQGNLSQMMMLTDKTKQRVCFLFNDLLVFAKEKDGGQLYYKGHIDLEAASVLEVPSDQIANAFVIMDKVDRSFYFQAETPISGVNGSSTSTKPWAIPKSSPLQVLIWLLQRSTDL